jgi:hypothetical protein
LEKIQKENKETKQEGIKKKHTQKNCEKYSKKQTIVKI